MRTPTRLIVCGIALLLAVAGCESMNDDKDKDRDRKDRERLDDRPASRGRGMDEIPPGATAVEGGEGSRLEYEPSRDGVIYVYDADADQVVFVGRIRDRERFRLDPDGGRALINSRTVMRSDLNPRHRYRLYFDRAN